MFFDQGKRTFELKSFCSASEADNSPKNHLQNKRSDWWNKLFEILFVTHSQKKKKKLREEILLFEKVFDLI
jgi:hypothetical protein